jgi:hypothetical protein
MTDECSGCGSTRADREQYRKKNSDDTISVDTKLCPHCGAQKCCMCDMGDDVACTACEGHGDDES